MPPQKSKLMILVEELCEEEWLSTNLSFGDKSLELHKKLKTDQRVIREYTQANKGSGIADLVSDTHSTIRKKCKLYTAIQSVLTR